MAGLRRTPAAQRLGRQLVQACHQRVAGHHIRPILGNDRLAIAILPDYERVAELRRSTYVDVVWLALAMHDSHRRLLALNYSFFTPQAAERSRARRLDVAPWAVAVVLV